MWQHCARRSTGKSHEDLAVRIGRLFRLLSADHTPALDLRDVSKAGMPGKTFAATTSMPASVATVCAAIQDFAGYPQFMPNVDKIKVTAAGGGASLDRRQHEP